MIFRIFSNLKSFRDLELKAGLNILLADKNETSTDKQTRNGAGKTSLIQLVHFVLGSDADKENIFRSELLEPWEFGLDLELAGKRLKVVRCGRKPSKILFPSGCASSWSIQPKPEKEMEIQSLSNNEWRTVLGKLMFGLEEDQGATVCRFKLSYRSLFSYFVRRQDSGGFVSHLMHATKQQSWDQHVSLSYLLGIDWSISRRFQELREQEKTIRQIKKSLKQGTIPGASESVATLRTKVTLTESKARRLKQQLDEFNVVEEYEAIEREASDLTREMNRLGNENTADREFLDQLRGDLESEKSPREKQT